MCEQPSLEPFDLKVIYSCFVVVIVFVLFSLLPLSAFDLPLQNRTGSLPFCSPWDKW